MLCVRRTAGAVCAPFTRTKPALRGLVLGALATGSLVSLTGTAHAYTESTCSSSYGASQVERVDLFRINHREGDFGDSPHHWGAPQKLAVVCFATRDRVLVKGRLFADAMWSVRVRVRFDFYNDGVRVSRASFAHSGSYASSRALQVARTGVDEVRIRTYDANGRSSVAWISLRTPPQIGTIHPPYN